MKASIISVGSEVLSGETVNTNTSYISQKLTDLGIQVVKHITVDDKEEEIISALKSELKQSKLIIFTGGLGPTEDDLTKEAICKYLNLKLIPYNPSCDRLFSYFKNKEAYEKNYKQVLFPENCQVMPNLVGTADGCIIKNEGAIIAILPGPPRENKAMVEYLISQYINKFKLNKLITRHYRLIDIGEWKAESIIKDLVKSDLDIATFARSEGLFIRVRIKEEDENRQEQQFKSIEGELKNRFENHILFEEITSPENMLASKLINEKISVATAESITGGMIASRLISVPGMSACLQESYITYSDSSKNKILGVSDDILREKTAVSRDVVEQMLNGLKKITNTQLQIAVSGYAGPGDKAGLVYIGVKYNNKITIEEKHYTGNRNTVRSRTASDAMILAYRKICLL